jgi:oligopeptide/dipeptide ABC transporter ATP-binding protein
MTIISETPTPLLVVDDLAVEFATSSGAIHAVNGISFTVAAGETVAIVGESGSGKSVSALAIMGLIPPPGHQTNGVVRFASQTLTDMPDRHYRTLRGQNIAMIFQDPLSSLNPAFRVEDQIVEAMTTHGTAKAEARTRAIELMESVGIANAPLRARDYPHQFSGGMRQRVMIAMAIANRPQLLIADEPTTALDVTIQAQVLDVLQAAKKDADAALLLITHDLGVVAGMADRVLVMYAGRIIEQGSVDEVLINPIHPYTRGLLAALPSLHTNSRAPLPTIAGVPPNLLSDREACALAPRCEFAIDVCRSSRPLLEAVSGNQKNHQAACFRAHDMAVLKVDK